MTADSRSVSSCRNLAKSSGDPPITSAPCLAMRARTDRKSTRLNSSHLVISYAVFCLKKKKQQRALLQGQKSPQAAPPRTRPLVQRQIDRILLVVHLHGDGHHIRPDLPQNYLYYQLSA